MRISLGRITNAWIVAIELEEGIREYAYDNHDDAIKHIQRLVKSVEENTEDDL